MPNFSSLWKGAQGAAKAAWGSPVGRSTMIGAGAGSAYGAMSDNTGVLEGAAKGGLLGGFGRHAFSMGKIGLRSYKSAIAGGPGRAAMSRGDALGQAMGRMGHGASLSANRAVNTLSSSLKKWGI